MKYLVDRIPITVLRDATGVGLYVYEISKDELCKEAKASVIAISRKPYATLLKKLCGELNVVVAEFEPEVKDHDELLVITTKIELVNEKDVDEYIKNGWVRLFKVRVRMTTLDDGCYGYGNNIDCSYTVCRSYVVAGGILEALVFDI